MEQPRAYAAHISRSLHDYTRLARRHLESLAGFVDNKQYAAAGSLAPARGAAEVYWLPGYHCVNGVPRVHRVGVHDPGHGLFVGVHVRSGNISLRSDEVAKLCRVASCHPFELA